MVNRLALPHGSHFYRVRAGDWRFRRPAGQLTRVRGDDAILVGILRRLAQDGGVDPGEGDDESGAAVAALRGRGVLVEAPAPVPDGRSVPGTVTITGTGDVAARLAGVIGEWCAVRREARLDRDAIDASEVVISCADWLPDRQWLGIDPLCRRSATAWHRAYCEGDAWVLGPLYIPGRTASYRDTRSRLLAASPQPAELRAFWSHLETGGAHRRAPVAPGTADVAAGLLAADVVALLTGAAVPSAGDQVLLHQSTMTVSRHPVLPIPPVWAAGDDGEPGR